MDITDPLTDMLPATSLAAFLCSQSIPHPGLYIRKIDKYYFYASIPGKTMAVSQKKYFKSVLAVSVYTHTHIP